MRTFIFLLLFLILHPLTSFGMSQELVGRMGIGFSNQLVNDIPTLSIKIQKSNAFAFGALLGFKSSDSNGGLGAGVRLYRILFDEPLLNFYTALTGAMITSKKNDISNSGLQFDLTLGSEFHFSGLESLGFSVEFGMSVNKLDDGLTLETVGEHMISAGIHFYI